MRATVVGAGVIGLTTAIALQRAGFATRIVTAAPPEQTTSAVAAAIWYPYRAQPPERMLGWARDSYAEFEALARDGAGGVRMCAGIELFRDPAPDPWWRDAVPELRHSAPEALPAGYRDAHEFAVPVVAMPAFLGYLRERFEAGGGAMVRARLASLEQALAHGPADVLVHCAGLGARELVGDRTMVPARGQIVRVENPGLERFVLDDEHPDGIVYIIPRGGDCVLGGTLEPGREDLAPDPDVAAAIVRRCAALEPRLAGARVLEHKVGLRPGRPVVRLERERLASGVPCVHNYGHGGAGVTLAWGCAREVVALATG